MVQDFYNYFERELELEGYCEYIIDYDYVDNSYENPPKKLYIFYINSTEGRFEFIFSKEFDFFDVHDIGGIYEEPDEILENLPGDFKIINEKYFAVNESDYLNRKLLQMLESPNKFVFYMYDFVIMVDRTKRVNNKELFIRNCKDTLPCEKEKFLNLVVFSKRTVAKPGSLEEKLYHYEDVSAQEKELFYRNKKQGSGGFKPAMKVR